MHRNDIPDFLGDQDLGEFPLRRAQKGGSLWRLVAAAGLVGASLGVGVLLVDNGFLSGTSAPATAVATTRAPAEPEAVASRAPARGPVDPDPVTVASIDVTPKTLERAPVAVAPEPPRATPAAPATSAQQVEVLAERLEPAQPRTDERPVTRAPVTPAPVNRAELQAQLDKAERLLKAGDLAAARLFFASAATSGDGRGALGMAKTYDDAVLRTLPVFGLRGEPQEAARWYRRAEELGANGAGRAAAAR